jgi:class 3 adenylate cyclase
MRDFIAQRLAEKHAQGRAYWNVRIGLHAGPAISGVVGTRKFAFDLWGDTLNTASRLESASEPGRINVSREFLDKLHAPVDVESRGALPLKGKGLVEQHFVLGWK